MRAYVINLARSSERRAHMLAELAKAGLEYSFVTAVDDRELDLRGSDTVDPSYFARKDWRPGQIGNCLSHLRAYEEILAEGLEQALVLEDDVTLSPDLGRVLDNVSEYLVGAEVALLNFDSHVMCGLSRDGVMRLPGHRLLALPVDVSVPVGAAGYVITREACERMAKSILPIRANSDNWGYWYSEGSLDRVRCVFPYAVYKDPSFESTIDYHSPTGFKARALKTIKRCRLPLFSRLVAYRRNTIFRKAALLIEFVDEPFVSKPSRLD